MLTSGIAVGLQANDSLGMVGSFPSFLIRDGEQELIWII